MSKLDDQPIELTRGDWNKLVNMVELLVRTICGDEQMNEKGMKREHDEMYEWFSHSKWFVNGTKTIIGLLGIGAVIGIIQGLNRLIEWWNSK
jgi:hypothetical protein